MNPKPHLDPSGQRPPPPRLRVPPALMALLAAGLTITIPSCKKPAPAAPSPPTVEVVAIGQQDVPVYREWVGSLAADVNATISAQVSGYLLRQDYTEGQNVKQGDLLFEIDARTYQASLDQSERQAHQNRIGRETLYAAGGNAGHQPAGTG